MRSCASRGAGLAGTERNRSSCVRSIRVTAEDDGRRGTASALRLHVEPLGGKADPGARIGGRAPSAKFRSEEHTSELQSLMRISYAVFCLKKKKKTILRRPTH